MFLELSLILFPAIPVHVERSGFVLDHFHYGKPYIGFHSGKPYIGEGVFLFMYLHLSGLQCSVGEQCWFFALWFFLLVV